MDDIVIFCKTSEEHLRYSHLIFNKLTTARFTINALKCKLCQLKINFLGHVIGPEAISAEPQSFAAILSHLAPWNQKQLWQFLGTWGISSQICNKLCRLCSSIEPYAEKKGSNGNGQLTYSKRLKNNVHSLLIASIWYTPTMSYHVTFTLMHLNLQSVLFSCRLMRMEKYILFVLHPEFWLLLNKHT